MKPLFVLLISFVIIYLVKGRTDYKIAASIAMCIMLLFTAMGHFMFTKGMVAMFPEYIPVKKLIVILSAILEIVLAIGLLFPATRKLCGITLVVFFICALPLNIYAAMHHVNYQTGETNGPGISYLWFRVPMQVFLIGWVYLSTLLK